MKIGFIGIVIICFVLIAGCTPKTVTLAEYVQWVKDETHGLHKVKELNGLRFDTQYKPAAYIVSNERRGNLSDKMGVENRIKKLSELDYFDLKIGSVDGSDFLKKISASQQEFYEKQYYFSFDFQRNLKLEIAGKQFPCVLFHFERDYDLKGARTFVLGFEKPKDESLDDKVLVIDANNLGLGIIKIKIEKENLEQIPSIQL